MVTNQSIERFAFGVPEAAKCLGVSRTLVFQLMASGKLKSIKLGNRRLIPRDELARICQVRNIEQARADLASADIAAVDALLGEIKDPASLSRHSLESLKSGG